MKNKGEYLCHFCDRQVQKMMNNSVVWTISVSHCSCVLRTSRVVGTESLVECVYVSKRACNCHVWEF